MGHCLTALITPLPIDEVKAAEMELAVVFEGGMAIVPIVPESLDEWSRLLEEKYVPYGRSISIDCSVTHRIAAILGLRSYSIVETEYFGGTGSQRASYFREGIKEWDEVPINQVLRFMGVEKDADKIDEFDTIGLGKYRHADDHRFWSVQDAGRRVGNILVGRPRFSWG